jgi:phosphatidylglycerophosphatase C
MTATDPVPEPEVQKVAAFDFDGTLVPGDSLRPFLTLVLGRSGFLVTLLQSTFAMTTAYLRGGRDEAKAALLARAVAQLDTKRVDQLGQAFGHQLAQRVRPDLVARLNWHRQQGHRLVLVSASLTNYLEQFASELGFNDLIATRLETGPNGRLTGLLLGRNVRGAEKATRLRSLLGTRPFELWAYGDSAGDREMLAMADHPTLVNDAALETP